MQGAVCENEVSGGPSATLSAEVAAPAAPARFRVMPGSYCGARLGLVTSVAPLPTRAPAELTMKTLVVEGLTPNRVPFFIVSDVMAALQFDASNAPIEIPIEGVPLAIDVDLAPWFSDVDLDGLIVSQDGVVHIDDSSNTSALQQLDGQLLESLRFGLDEDGNGRLEDNEASIVGTVR